MTPEERYNRLHQIGVLLTLAHELADELADDPDTSDLHATIQLALDHASGLEDAENEALTDGEGTPAPPIH
jgi:hypothetical protein